jgi:hypothetical protein
MISVRAQNWLREINALDAARDAGAEYLPICAVRDPVAEEISGFLEKVYTIEEIGGVLCIRIPNAAKDAQGIYRPPMPEPEAIDLSKETKETLAARLVQHGHTVIGLEAARG